MEECSNMEFWRAVMGDSDDDDEEFCGFTEGDLTVVKVEGGEESDLELDFDTSVSPEISEEEEEIERSASPSEGVWSSKLCPVEPEPFQEFVGVHHDLEVGADPISYFNLLVGEDFFDKLEEETNLYAAQKEEESGQKDPNWRPVTPDELRLYLAICIMMGIHKLPRKSHYWSGDDRLNVPAVSKLMSETRYDKISQYLHLNDSSMLAARGQPGHDPLHKVRPLITKTSDTFSKHYKPNRRVSIDEAIIKFNGRLHFTGIHQKPTPCGIKVWCCCDPETGYLLAFDVYTGKTHHIAKGGLGHHVVTTVGAQYLHKYHHFFFDNFFNSVSLQKELLDAKTYACGTIHVNRKGWPKDLVFNQKRKKVKKLNRGETRMLQQGDMVATVWQNQRTVSVLSTGVQPTMGSAMRQSGRGKTEKEVPTPVLTYNGGMGGVDNFNQHRQYYSLGRQSRKLWRYLFWFLLEAVIVNSHIIFKMTNRPRPKSYKAVDPVTFRLGLYDGLMKGRVVARRRSKEVPSNVARAFGDPTEHQLDRLFGRKRGCSLCVREARKTASGRSIETVFGCTICKVHLCKDKCFAKFHAQLLS